MSRVLKRAEKGAAKEKAVKKKRHKSESEDSNDLQEELDAEAELKELKRAKKARREEADAIRKKTEPEEQEDKNARRGALKEISKKRNEFPVMLYMNRGSNELCIDFCWFPVSFVDQTEEAPPFSCFCYSIL